MSELNDYYDINPDMSLFNVSAVSGDSLHIFKDIADPCFTIVDYNELHVNFFATVYVGGTLISGALIIDNKSDYIEVHCLCTKDSLQGLGYGSKLVQSLQHFYCNKAIHVLATSDAVDFYKKYQFETKNRTTKCCCERNELKHLVWKNSQMPSPSTDAIAKRRRDSPSPSTDAIAKRRRDSSAHDGEALSLINKQSNEQPHLRSTFFTG